MPSETLKQDRMVAGTAIIVVADYGIGVPLSLSQDTIVRTEQKTNMSELCLVELYAWRSDTVYTWREDTQPVHPCGRRIAQRRKTTSERRSTPVKGGILAKGGGTDSRVAGVSPKKREGEGERRA